MNFGDELIRSAQEAVDIKNGKIKPSRVTRYEVVDVKAIRESLGVTQEDFAAGLNASLNTIKSWESKRRNPTGLAESVLRAIQKDPKLFSQIAAA